MLSYSVPNSGVNLHSHPPTALSLLLSVSESSLKEEWQTGWGRGDWGAQTWSEVSAQTGLLQQALVTALHLEVRPWTLVCPDIHGGSLQL